MIDEEQEAFQRLVMAHFAHLSEQAGCYTGAMSARDREAVLASALEFAWQRRLKLKPSKTALYRFWDACLQSAILERSHWMLHRWSGWERVSSHRIVNDNALGVDREET